MNKEFNIVVASEQHLEMAETICEEMANSAKARGTGIAKRTPDYIQQKMQEGKAVIATTKDGRWAGFCYIETWSHGKYVANSGLIVSPEFRKTGLAKRIKDKIFQLSRKKYPEAKIFGLTTGLAVMKINSDLGYEPVPYSELTDDEAFWAGCNNCVNFEILTMKGRQNCLCTAMLYDPNEKRKKILDFAKKGKLYERFMRIKKDVMLKRAQRKEGKQNKKTSIFNLFSF